MKQISLFLFILAQVAFTQGVSRYGTNGFGEAQSPWKYRKFERVWSFDVMLEEGIDRFSKERIDQERLDSTGSFQPYARDKMNYIGMGQASMMYAHDWTAGWRSGLRQTAYFQSYKIKAEQELDNRKGISFSDLHYWDQVRLFQNRYYAVGALHEVFVPWAQNFARGTTPHFTTNPALETNNLGNLQSANEWVQGLQLQFSYVPSKLKHDFSNAVHLNLGMRYYWQSQNVLPIAVLGVQTRMNDEWVVWGTASQSVNTSFEQGLRYRPNKHRTFDFFMRQVPFQGYDTFTWQEDVRRDNTTALYRAKVQRDPKLLIGFKASFSWSPRRITKIFSNADKYLDPHTPFNTFGETYFIPAPVVGDSLPMPSSKVYKGFSVDKILEPTTDAKEILDSIAEEMTQHPVRVELRVVYGESSNSTYNERLGRELGVNLGNYLVKKGISKRRIRVKPMGKEGLESWESARLITKVYSLPLEPPKKITLQKDGVLREVTFNRDGFLTDKGKARLRLLSMQMEQFDLQIEFIVKSNRSKDPEENLRLSKDNAKTIGEFLVAAGVSPDDLKFQHLGSQDIPETDNELVEVIVSQKEPEDY